MTHDFRTEQAEQDDEDQLSECILKDAAILIQQGHSRSSAIREAKEIADWQNDADNDSTGAIGTLSEAQSPPMPADPAAQRQVRAIWRDLLSSEA